MLRGVGGQKLVYELEEEMFGESRDEEVEGGIGRAGGWGTFYMDKVVPAIVPVAEPLD